MLLQPVPLAAGLCSAVALIVALLCVFAGDNPWTLEGDYVLSLNTSRFAANLFNTSADSPDTSNPGQFWAHVIPDGASADAVRSVTGQIERDVRAAADDAASSFASVLGVSEFYDLHLLTYCQGYHSHGPVDALVVTCSNLTGAFSHFYFGDTLQRELTAAGTGVTLADLHWPAGIDDAVAALQAVVNAAYVLYCIAVVFILGGMGAAAVAVWRPAPVLPLVNFCLTQVAFWALLIASAAVTAGTFKAVKLIDQYGAAVDVSANYGTMFLGMTWAATVLEMIATAAWGVHILLLRRKGRMMPKEFE